MRSRKSFWILLCLLCLAGAWLFWHQASRAVVQKKFVAKPTVVTVHSTSTAPKFLTTVSTKAAKAAIASTSTNQFAYRLSNTSKSIGELVHDDKAILLENALIDLRIPLNFSIPKNLQSQGDPGAYIVQANGPIDNAFRAMLAAAGAQIVSYIPNDAYLVRASAGIANGIAADGFSVVPYEPYYKISTAPMAIQKKNSAWSPTETNRVARTTLLDLAVNQKPLPSGTDLKLGLFSDNAAATIGQIEKLGGKILSQDRSPFGPVVRVQPPKNWTALVTLPGVQIVEPAFRRAPANDLARVTLGVSTDTVTNVNYMNLTGKNVIVEINDSGVDATHPDLAPRVFGDAPQSLVDTNGHGTHVAGIIASSGVNSKDPPGPTDVGANASGSVTNADFRGKAPAAELYSVGGIEGDDTNFISDSYMQEQPALTNALISNNSWGNGDAAYDLSAASYDAATRDALPGVTGSQPVLFVFAAGNSGPNPDTISSPGTAKNVITVGATEQQRNITNYVIALDGSSNQVWLPMTDLSSQVASFSSSGNVGIGVEGTFGRYKPDVVAPGTFVVSTRSAQWDQAAYYNPTNVSGQDFTDQTVNTNAVIYYNIDLSTTPNVVGITIQVVSNNFTTSSLNLPIYVSSVPNPNNFPDPTTPSTYFLETNTVSIPPNGGAGYLTTAIANGGFNYAVGSGGSQPANYDLIVEITTTNDNGNYYTVLSNLNNTLGPYYRYETGTSMAAPAVSGVLALMQDFFTNQWGMRPSPALMKAMVINGARTTGFYDLQVQNTVNNEGWGLVNLPDSLPTGLTTNFSTACSSFILDQNPATALATGDSQTFMVTLNTNNALAQPLRVTLAWTDPPGNPAAATKLVNNLNLVVTDLDNPANPVIYYGNDISSGDFNNPESVASATNIDVINNVQNVYLPAGAGTNFSVTVMGYRVNVNAVTAQTNNVVQDYALVISSGNGQTNNAITVSAPVIASNPTGDQQITYVPSGNSTELLNQTVGANTPLLGTNTLSFNNTTAPENLGTNWQVTIGMTNQWHFYVVTNPPSNSADFTNAAFVTFAPDTLSIPRMGVFAGSQANATQPEADIDLYVSTNPALTNLDTNVISAAIISGTVSLGRGGTEFVVETNSTPREVYYVGVKSETQEASEYDFLPIFSATPFSVMQNGVESLTGVPVPAPVDGNPAVPGFVNVIGIATFPIQIRDVVVSNTFYAEDFSDLVGAVNHNDTSVILNNHNSPNAPGTYTFIYDDSGQNSILGSQPSAEPGGLNSFIGADGTGVWILHEADNAEGFSNVVDSFNVTIQPHQTTDDSHTNTIAPSGSYLDYVDVPLGATNLTITVTNLTGTANPPLELFVKYGSPPTTNSFDEMTLITHPDLIGLDGSISIGPPLTSGTYYYAVFNPGTTPQQAIITASVGLGTAPAQIVYSSSGPVPLLDDAVTTNSIYVTQDKTISSVEVALRVDHPRVSDLVFHLISPDGTRDLLVENRGGTTTNGMGVTLTASNTVAQPQISSGNGAISTNVINTGQPSGTLTIQYNFYTVPDEMVVRDAGNNLIFDSGEVSGSGVFTITYTNAPLTIIMNPNGNSAGAGDLWDYTVDATGPSYEYLVLTEDTNKTTTPIKFAPPPFVPVGSSASVFSDFETAAAGDYVAPTNIVDESTWNVTGNQVSVVNDPANAQGNKFLALANGTITNTLPTVAGKTYTLTFASRGPGIVSWWRGESNSLDSIGGNDGTTPNGINYAAGEVNNSFNLNGINQFVLVNPSSPANLDVGQGSGFTIEGWIKPTATASSMTIAEYERILASGNAADVGVQFTINAVPLVGVVPGALSANIVDTTGANHILGSAGNLVIAGVWQHVALTYNKASGIAAFYLNGAVVTQANLGNFTPQTSFTNLLLGARTYFNSVASPTSVFAGGMDEISLYNRALSTSEIKAIYTDGTAGKFDPAEFSASPAQSLAKVQIGVNGSTPSAFFGNNTTWQSQSATFTATQTGTPLVISGLEPGMLLDTFTSTQAGGDLYYLPEQSLDTYDGKDANGQWTLEVQDDRAGATSFAPSLVSWQLRFNFTTTTTPASSVGTLTNGVPQTNTIPANSIAYYLVNVPTNADFATNLLFTTSGPLSLWFNQTNLPSGTNSPGDTLLFSTSVNDSDVLSTISTPTNIVPGGSYYLAVQNTNSFAITNYAVEVNFHLVTVTNLIGGQPQTNAVALAPGGFAFFAVSVPTNADIATNTLLFATAPVNLLFNQTNLPTGLGAGDFTLLSASTGGSTNLTVAGSPPLIPGTTYYLGVQNTNGVPVTFGIGVNFHLLVPISPPIIISSITHTNIGGTNGFWLKWWAPTNDIFQVQWTGNLASPIAWNTFSNIITYTGPLTPTNGLFTFFDDGSQFPFGPLRFYRLILLGSGLTNGVELTNSIPANSIAYYSISVPTNADFSTNSLFMTNGPLSLLFNQTVPPTGTNSGDYVLFSASANASAILSTNSPLPFFVPGGTYYLGVQNTNSFAVNYGIEVDFHLFTLASPLTNAVSISGITVTNIGGGTNAILLHWIAPANYQFQIQWATNLAAPIAWNTVSNVVVTSTTTNYFYLDDGSLTGGFGPLKFYRLIEYPYSTPIPLALSISSAKFTANGIQFQWSAPTNYQYEIEWTTNLALPLSSWLILTNPVLSVNNTVFTFTDTNQTGPSTSTKFFRLVAAP